MKEVWLRLFESVIFSVTLLALIASAYGWWFYFAVGPAHGPGAEIGIITGIMAIGGFFGWRAVRRNRRGRG